MKNFLVIAVLLAGSIFISCSHASTSNSKLPTPSNVDVARYIGKWYAITSLPQIFTCNCVAQSAEYGILGENTISVINTCYKKNGKTSDIKGKGVVKDTQTNARLEITFDNFFTKLFKVKGEYVIVKLSEGYDTVLIGSTNRKSLWIMSRTPSIQPEVLAEYVNYAKSLGFPVEKLVNSKF
jgi:apolipoprotein D and lipocalin family protein